MAGRRRWAGGILGLLDLIEEHKTALQYDWRTRFQRGLRESVPDDIGWDEAIDLVRILRADPSSALAAAMEGWDHPVSRVELILMDIWDLMAAKTGAKNPPRYPRPWKQKGEKVRHGNADGLDQAEVKARLAAMAGRPAPPV